MKKFIIYEFTSEVEATAFSNNISPYRYTASRPFYDYDIGLWIVEVREWRLD